LLQTYRNITLFPEVEVSVEKEFVVNRCVGIAHVGSWDWDIRNGTHHWSDESTEFSVCLPRRLRLPTKHFSPPCIPTTDRQCTSQSGVHIQS
jgi:hypothetical protein